MDEVRGRLERLPFWQRLTAAEQALVFRSTVVQNMPKGMQVHGCQEDCLGMLLVKRGAIRVYLLSEEGKEVTLFHLREGEACVLSASCVVKQLAFDTQMVAEEDCELMVIGAGAIAHLMEGNIYARAFFFELATERFSAVMWSMQQILFMRVDKRLATFLLGEYVRTGLVEIKMTHEQIAQQISSAREVVARMLKRFSNEGLVEVRRGSIRILDLNGLEELKR